MNINKKRLIMGLIIFIIIVGINLTLPNYSKAAYKANIKQYTVKTDEQNLSTEKFVNVGTIQYEQPSPVYDFFDENGNLNVIYTSETNVYWSKFNSNMQAISTIKFAQYYDKSNSPGYMKNLIFNFGNAVYYKKYLYIVYGRQGTGVDNASSEDTMAVVKYDKNGNIVGKITLNAAANCPNTSYKYGTLLPFYPSSNCSLTVNEKDDTLACFFQTHMYNGHERAGLFFIDTNTMEWVSNQYETNEQYLNKYNGIRGYYSSHSMSQRIIATSDGGYLLADQNDASNRGLLITKVEPDDNGNLNGLIFRMINFREGGNFSHGYNYTHLIPGNLIELSDGYMYIGAMERTLDLNYGYSINESWDLFVQKYDKDLIHKETTKDAQMFNTTPISATGNRPTENVYGSLFLNGTEKNYGIKWLTNLKNKKMVVDVNAVKIENDKTVILYELLDLKEESSGGYSYTNKKGEVYYIIIDKERKDNI